MVPARSLGSRLQRTALRIYRRLSHLRFRRSAQKLAKAERADIWVAHDLDTLQIAERARRRFGGGLVYDSHELFLERAVYPPHTKLGRARWRRIEQRLIRRADRVTTVCRSIAKELAQRYGIQEPALVMNAPNYEEPSAEPSSMLRSLTGLPPATRIVLYVGNIQYSRPLHLLVEAAQYLEDDCVVVIVGPVVGTAAASLQKIVSERGMEKKVIILPPVPQSDVVALASGADLGIVPLEPVCLNHVYALPNKLFQYLMAGLPVAASPMTEISRLLEQYDVGAVFPQNEPKAIADTVMQLLADTQSHRRLRDNALRAAKELSWEQQAPTVLASVAEAYAMRWTPRKFSVFSRDPVDTRAE
ncbi:MAG: glycosyltransferase [Rhodothermales bacterium]|nr:glycosyltransferase [Rhodothermales bacterium]